MVLEGRNLAGIPIQVHATFALLLAWIALSHVLQGHGMMQAAGGLLLILSIFSCVVLHELSHALTARRFGIRTRDITLLPIGGVARLERMPEKPAQELLVALAGPIMSFAIAGALFGVLALRGGSIAAALRMPYVGRRSRRSGRRSRHSGKYRRDAHDGAGFAHVTPSLTVAEARLQPSSLPSPHRFAAAECAPVRTLLAQ
jgi:membrane-associated protease RseP (regulator of RpoE activity)